MLRTSPLLEIYRKKDLEVLILDDEIDEIVFSGVDKYGDIDLKSVNKTSASEDLKDEAEPDKTEALKPLLEKIKSHAGRSGQRCARVGPAGRQSFVHRFGRRRTLDEDAGDAARHRAEGHSRTQAHA